MVLERWFIDLVEEGFIFAACLHRIEVFRTVHEGRVENPSPASSSV